MTLHAVAPASGVPYFNHGTMMTEPRTPSPRAGWLAGNLAGLASMAVLAWRGRTENGRALGPVNAPSHWVWGDAALQEDRPSPRHTGLGVLIHQGSALMWGLLYERLVRRHRPPLPMALELRDAAAATAAAAVVDLVLTPKRFTPGFERRLSVRGTVLVYAAFAVGLAVGSRLGQARR